tara:strand:- start:493 stop:873 length:381 start_codon:yes stop_codon:yes gene_type:complete
MYGISSPHYKTIEEYLRYANNASLVLTGQTDIPAGFKEIWNYRGYFHFVIYYHCNGAIDCIYSDNKSSSQMSLVSSHPYDVDRYNRMVHEFLPEYWEHSMPEEDKQKLLHALQNIYPIRPLTKADG